MSRLCVLQFGYSHRNVTTASNLLVVLMEIVYEKCLSKNEFWVVMLLWTDMTTLLLQEQTTESYILG